MNQRSNVHYVAPYNNPISTKKVHIFVFLWTNSFLKVIDLDIHSFAGWYNYVKNGKIYWSQIHYQTSDLLTNMQSVRSNILLKRTIACIQCRKSETTQYYHRKNGQDENLFLFFLYEDRFMPNVNFNRPWNCRKLYAFFYSPKCIQYKCISSNFFASIQRRAKVLTIKVDHYSSYERSKQS